MDSIQTCDLLLNLVKNSNLNFSLTESPFSVTINIKKSFIKDKNGIVRVSNIGGFFRYNCQSIDENQILQEENKSLKTVLAQHKDENEALSDTTHVLGIKLEKAKKELTETIFEKNQLVKAKEATLNDLDMKNHEIESLTDVLKKLRTEKENQKQEIKSKILKNKEKEFSNVMLKNEGLEDSLNKAKLEVEKLTLEKIKTEKELLKIETELKKIKQPIPSASKSTNTILTTTNTASTNTLPSSIATDSAHNTSSSSTSSSLTSGHNLPPVSSKGFVYRPTNPINPPQSCFHTTQCIVREPSPPPLPSITPLVNYSSQYHEKIQSGSLDWGSTCPYCMRIEYERYGCDSCIWIKCFGELHGYPDVNPYDYKKHLLTN